MSQHLCPKAIIGPEILRSGSPLTPLLCEITHLFLTNGFDTKDQPRLLGKV